MSITITMRVVLITDLPDGRQQCYMEGENDPLSFALIGAPREIKPFIGTRRARVLIEALPADGAIEPPISDAQIAAWAARNGLNSSICDARAAFDDACATLRGCRR